MLVTKPPRYVRTLYERASSIFEFLSQMRRDTAFDRHGRPVPALFDG